MRLLRILTVLALATLPAAWRYSSFGLDFERASGADTEGTYWRLRWPGDGSVALCWLREQRSGAPGPAIDLGGRFLQRAVDPRPANGWQRLGFWWIDADAAIAPVPHIVAGAERAFLIGAPHWLLALALASATWLQHRRGTRTASA